MPVTADKPAPYAPGSTILEVIDRFRSRGLPSPITAEVLGRAGIAPTVLPRVLQSLQSLDLIDDDFAPTKTFETIRRAPEPEYRARLEEWLKGTYADVFTYVDPTKDDKTRIRDAFRNYEPVAQQPRMVSLFQALCGAAGLINENATAAARSAPRAPRPTIPRRPPPPSSTSSKRGPAVKANAYGLPPAIAGLMESLPSAHDGWTAAERDKFVTTFEAVLDFAIPIIRQKAAASRDEEEAA